MMANGEEALGAEVTLRGGRRKVQGRGFPEQSTLFGHASGVRVGTLTAPHQCSVVAEVRTGCVTVTQLAHCPPGSVAVRVQRVAFLFSYVQLFEKLCRQQLRKKQFSLDTHSCVKRGVCAGRPATGSQAGLEAEMGRCQFEQGGSMLRSE